MGQSKLKNRVSWKMFEMEFKFSKLVKSIVFSVSEPKNGWPLNVTDKVNMPLLKKMKKICKILEKYGWIFLPTNDFSLLQSCQLCIITKHKASNCCKIEHGVLIVKGNTKSYFTYYSCVVVCGISAICPSVFSLYKNYFIFIKIRFLTHVSKNMLPKRFWVN